MSKSRKKPVVTNAEPVDLMAELKKSLGINSPAASSPVGAPDETPSETGSHGYVSPLHCQSCREYSEERDFARVSGGTVPNATTSAGTLSDEEREEIDDLRSMASQSGFALGPHATTFGPPSARILIGLFDRLTETKQ